MDKLTETIVEAIQDKKGKGIVVLDLSVFDGAISDTFVICNAASTTQVAAIAGGIEESFLEKTKEKVWRVEGLTNAIWVVMDYGNVMVHIFQSEAREFYRLENMWADAPAITFKDQD